jgi:hypothetical protein
MNRAPALPCKDDRLCRQRLRELGFRVRTGPARSTWPNAANQRDTMW